MLKVKGEQSAVALCPRLPRRRAFDEISGQAGEWPKEQPLRFW